MDYTEIGFKAGLEIHQQLDTYKLFCHCESKITEQEVYRFERTLRPTQSELGDVDRAALEEAARKRRFLYTASRTSTCLVEADEEPPHAANSQAVDISLTMALLLKAQPVDEIQFMRKIVIDGSNTSGFQRTALIALGGSVENVRISTLALEEDAARKLSEKDKLVRYGLDRLGIPLIEITTEADITSPEHAEHIAGQLGLLLQATKKVKRGLGTIRQDLNISLSKGARVEVKGIQSLSSISKVAENECLRQKGIVEIAEILNSRAKKNDLKDIQSKDLTAVFLKTKSNLIKDKQKDNACIKGIRLPGYQGLLTKKQTGLGKDFAVYTGLTSGIDSIIHSDEMQMHGISDQEVEQTRQSLELENHDAFVLALGDETMVDAAVEAIRNRAMMYFDGVPEEVRRSLPDNTTEYMRPLPGAARMYPETDVPPIRITQEHLQELLIPEKPSEKRQRLAKQYHLNEEQIHQLLSSGYEDDFEKYVSRYPGLENVILRTYINTIAELQKEGIDIQTIDETTLITVLSALQEGKFAKEAAPQIIQYLCVHPTASLEEAILSCGFTPASQEEIIQVIHTIITERKDFVKQRGTNAVGPLMGVVMKQLRGKADGQLISKILQQEIEKVISS